MKQDMDQIMLDLNGEPFGDESTLKSLCLAVLMTPVSGDEQQPLDKRIRQFGLMQKINAGGIIDLQSEEISLIKDRAAKTLLNVVALGKLCEALEAGYQEP